MARFIEVIDHDPGWAVCFEQERDLLKPVFGKALVEVHHIGSTAVPGLQAKPIIDILAEVASGTDVIAFYPQMEALGYNCRGECLDAEIPGTPGRYYFSKNKEGIRYAHVHVCHEGHAQICELIALRDFLRAHPEEAARYGALKLQLAGRYPYANLDYMRRKDGLVRELVASAVEWWQSEGRGR